MVQSISSVKIATLLRVRAPAPDGFLIFGGGSFCRMLAKELISHNVPVILADTNWVNISAARMDSVPTYFDNPMSEHAERTLDLSAFGRVLVMSPYRQLNPLVTYHFENHMGKGTVLGLSNNEQQQRPSHQVSESYAKKLGLFSEGVTYAKLAGRVSKGAKIKNTRLSDSFSEADYDKQYNGRAIRLGAISPNGKVTV